MSVNKPKITKKEVSQKFNLKELFGVDFSKNSDLRDQIGQAIIDKMVERTAEGKAIGGQRNLKGPYSAAYKDSDDYKDFRKSGEINMNLTGRMMGDIDIINDTINTIKIGFGDELETKKAFRHNTGDMGMPKREFFGVTESEIKSIGKEFSAELEDLKNSEKPKLTIGDLIAAAAALGVILG